MGYPSALGRSGTTPVALSAWHDALHRPVRGLLVRAGASGVRWSRIGGVRTALPRKSDSDFAVRTFARHRSGLVFSRSGWFSVRQGLGGTAGCTGIVSGGYRPPLRLAALHGPARPYSTSRATESMVASTADGSRAIAMPRWRAMIAGATSRRLPGQGRGACPGAGLVKTRLGHKTGLSLPRLPTTAYRRVL